MSASFRITLNAACQTPLTFASHTYDDCHLEVTPLNRTGWCVPTSVESDYWILVPPDVKEWHGATGLSAPVPT